MDKKEEIEAVKKLGEQIGYGHLMSIASSLWRENLRAIGAPESGAFVVTCLGQFDEAGERIAENSAKNYDSYIEKHYK